MIFKRKPTWTAGRWLHLTEAFVATCVCGHFWGDAGLVAGTALCVLLGGIWEFVNHWWPPGWWMFGDVVDFIFFVLGALLADVVVVLLTGGIV